MKALLRSVVLAAVALVGLSLGSAPAAAQSCPAFSHGAVLTAGQWQACFDSKQNALGYTPVNKAGDTMLGRLVTVAPGTVAGFNLVPGSAPSSPANGDLWATSSGFFGYANGTTYGPFASASASTFAATSPLSVTFPAGVVTYALNYDSNFTVGGGNLKLASAISVTTSVAINGCTIGTDALCATGTATFSGVINSAAAHRAYYATSIPAGGTAGAGFTLSSTSNFGMFFGSGAPTLTAAQGSLYLRSDGGASTRFYVNTNGTTGWSANGDAGITALTGDVTATGPGSVAATLATTQPAVHTWTLGQTFSAAMTYGGVTLANSVVGTGSMVLSTNATLTTPNIGAATGTSLSTTGAHTAFSGTAIPAGGTQDAGFLFSSTAHFGTIFGSGAPTASMAQGSLYLRSDGAVGTRAYINTNGTTTYVALADVNVTTLSSLASIGTITTGVWQGTSVTAGFGGTGISSYAVGDLLYASGSTTLSKLAAVATGQVLVSAGVTTAPAWSATPALTSVALAGCTIGTDKLCATGTINVSSTATLGAVKTASIFPPSDSTTALQIFKADGSTRVMDFDTTNARVGINKTPGAFDLDVNATVNVGTVLTFGTLSATSLAASTSTITGLTANNSPDSANDYFLYYSAGDGAIRKCTIGACSSAGAAGVTSLNGLTGGLTISDGTSTLTISASVSTISVGINLAHANTWTATQTFSAIPIVTSGNFSAAAWTTAGVRIKSAAASYTDTTSSGTVATAYTDLHGASTILASSSTTYTNYFGAYYVDPIASTNVTMTNKWALGADSLKIGTSNQMTVTTAGVLTATSPVFSSPTFSGTVAGAGTIPLTILATQAADTALVNATGGSASPTAVAIGSCSAASSALTYNTSTHAFGCNTITSAGLSSAVSSLTRSINASSGSVGYTGCGFQPTSVLFMPVATEATVGVVNYSLSFADSAKNISTIYFGSNGTAMASGRTTNLQLWDPTSKDGASSVGTTGTISSYDSTGFTISWTKNGSPSGYTSTVSYICYK